MTIAETQVSVGTSLYLKGSGQITGSEMLFKGGRIGGMTVTDTKVHVGSILELKDSGQITGSAVLFKGGTIGGFTLSSTTLESDSSNTKRGIKLEPGKSIRGYGNTAHSTTCIAGKYSFGVAPVSPPAGGDGGWNSDFPPDGGGGGSTL